MIDPKVFYYNLSLKRPWHVIRGQQWADQISIRFARAELKSSVYREHIGEWRGQRIASKLLLIFLLILNPAIPLLIW